MIVRPGGDGIQLITQPDHAHLAGRIMERCVPLAQRPRRASILHAIAEHDNGWTEQDAAPTVNPATGAVVDFVGAPVGVRQSPWPRGVGRLAIDPWAAALVAHHSLTVYQRFVGDPEWTGFFSEMERMRDAMVREVGLALDALVDDYQFLRLGDLISLAFCTGWTAEQRFRDWTVQLVGPRVVVIPDAFGGATIPIDITARDLRSRTFQSDEELRRAFDNADTITLRGDVSGTPPQRSR